jgi:hypothetical protein
MCAAPRATSAFLFVSSGGWSFFWLFLVDGLSFDPSGRMVFLLVVSVGRSFFWLFLVDGFCGICSS